MMRRGKKTGSLKKGYTLTEVLLVVIIIAILAAIAIPGYSKMSRRQRCSEGRDALLSIYAGEKVFASVNNDAFFPVPAKGMTMQQWNDNLYMDDPSPPDKAISYSVAVAGAAPNMTFIATARFAGDADIMTINQTRTLVPDPNAVNACPWES